MWIVSILIKVVSQGVGGRSHWFGFALEFGFESVILVLILPDGISGRGWLISWSIDVHHALRMALVLHLELSRVRVDFVTMCGHCAEEVLWHLVSIWNSGVIVSTFGLFDCIFEAEERSCAFLGSAGSDQTFLLLSRSVHVIELFSEFGPHLLRWDAVSDLLDPALAAPAPIAYRFCRFHPFAAALRSLPRQLFLIIFIFYRAAVLAPAPTWL